MDDKKLKKIIEATIFISDQTVTVESLLSGVLAAYDLKKRTINQLISELKQDYSDKGINLVETGAGFKFVTAEDINEELSTLWEEKAPRYSRALLETLALIAYKQPITKAEIESVRGVGVAHTIMRTLTERQWIKVIGHKEVPGRPAFYGTTKEFMEYFQIKSLEELPELENVTFEMLREEQQQMPLMLEANDQMESEPENAEHEIADAKA